jgi:hypothetical protein
MRINLWYSENMKQWRWTLTKDVGKSLPYQQESGSSPFLHDAMRDVANTVEYLINLEQQ